MPEGACTKCGSTEVARDLPIADHDGQYADKALGLRLVPAQPQVVLGLQIVKPEYVPLHVSICGACGAVETYCGDLPRLRALVAQGYVFDRSKR